MGTPTRIGAYRRARPGARLGYFRGDEKVPDADVVFASVQTLSRPEHLQAFARDRFDYNTIDEFHHADARTYRDILARFDPQFLLGLTATPERTDGGDLLALCGENLAFRVDLFEGVERGLLSPFHYFGVPDQVAYENIPWRSYPEEQLTRLFGTQARAQNALEQLERHGGRRTLVFCVSIAHADFMAAFFEKSGKRVAVVHSGPRSAPRDEAIERLTRGDIDLLITVDMFNEGVDIPLVDTVLMLRPTESSVLWFQQIGRGLRKHPEKDRLRIIDYVGNHKVFLRALSAVLSLDGSPLSARDALAALRAAGGKKELPGGCHVTYELEAIDILEKLARATKKEGALRAWVDGFVATHGRRPTALEAFHDGMSPAELPAKLGGWFGALRAAGHVRREEALALDDPHAEALVGLVENTRMTRSYKMLVLLAWLDGGGLFQPASVEQLATGVARIARRTGPIALDVSVELTDHASLMRLLREQPIAAWTKDEAASATLTFADDQLSLAVAPAPSVRAALTEMVRELAEWRLAEHLSKRRADRVQTVFATEGAAIDAHFTTEVAEGGAFAILVESRGGKGGGPDARNTEYGRGLRLVLERLRSRGATLRSVALATREAEGPLVVDGYALPLALSDVHDIDALGRAIQRAQGNNPTRRIRLEVEPDPGTPTTAQQLHRFLSRGAAA